MNFFVKLLIIFPLCFPLFGKGNNLSIDIFNTKVELPTECKINASRSSKKFTEYVCTDDIPMSTYSLLGTREFNYSDISSFMETFKNEGSFSKIYTVNGYELFELSSKYDESINSITFICDPYFCIYIMGDYKNIVETIKKQVL